MATDYILGPVSSYAIAQKYGFTGTEQEWVQTIINASGDYAEVMEAIEGIEGQIPLIDSTLTHNDRAANAYVTGERLSELEGRVTTNENEISTLNEKTANIEVIEYNILDYDGNTLNERWNNMKADFVSWKNKYVLIPYPREDCDACIKINNDWKWKISEPIIFDDSCNCINIDIYGELYTVAPVEQVLLFDDSAKPENVNFLNGIQIRGDRNSNNTIDCAIEVRAGARINFFEQTIINDCKYGIIIGGDEQSAPSEAYFDRVQIAFFDVNAVYVHGDVHTSNIFAKHIETALAQNEGLDAVLISGNVPNSKIGFLTYGTDVVRTGYTTYNANSVLKCIGALNRDTHNIIVDFIYATEATYVAYLDGSGDGGVYDIHLGTVGGSTSSTVAIYARHCSGLTVDNIKRDNLININNCFYSRIGRQTIGGSDTIDRFVGLNATVNIDGVTGINDVPSTSYKEIGAITIVKNANGKKAYIYDGDSNIQIDGQMFVPAISSLPTPAWNLRGKMYRVNNDSGQDVIAVCIRYNGNSYKWFDLITNTVI